MKITLERVNSTTEATVGILRIDGVMQGFTLEDGYQEVKIFGKTRIPAGTYPIALRTEGDMIKRYIKKFGDKHAGMLWIQDIPEFTHVYFHIGNGPDDTMGCVLIGQRYDITAPEWIAKSTALYGKFHATVQAAIQFGEEVTLVITDSPWEDN